MHINISLMVTVKQISSQMEPGSHIKHSAIEPTSLRRSAMDENESHLAGRAKSGAKLDEKPFSPLVPDCATSSLQGLQHFMQLLEDCA